MFPLCSCRENSIILWLINVLLLNTIIFLERDEKSKDSNTEETSKDGKYTLTIVVVLIVGFVIGAIFVLTAVYLFGRCGRRKSQNVTAVKYAINPAT